MTLQITTTLTVPDSSAGRAAFVAAANQFGDDLTPWANEANAMAIEMNSNATAAATAKTNAETAQGLAEDARDAAIAASTSIADDYNPASHAYAKNDLAWDAPRELYRCILGYTSTATTPSADPTHWARVNLTPDDVAALYATVNAQLDVPSVVKTAAYTLTLAERGKCVDTTANITVPPNASVAFPVGALVAVTNTSASNISLLQGAGVTIRLAGTTTTGNRTLAPWGQATLRKVGSDVWLASGMGVS